MADQLLCPRCGESIAITDAISKQLKAEMDTKLQSEISKQKALFEEQNKELKEKEVLLKKQQQQLEVEVAKKLEAKELEIKKELWAKAQAKANEEVNLKLKSAQDQIEEQQEKIKTMTDRELVLLKKEREVEEAKRELELQAARKLEEERGKLIEDTEKRIQETMRLQLLEKEKQLEDTKKALLEAQRKAAQGSQQQQGEVLELDLEKNLKETFIYDCIDPVAKGVSGADIVHKVCSTGGVICGVILWEVKQTKHWTEGWVAKFKDDLRSQKANIPVLVSTALPKDIEGLGFYKGIWVTEPRLALQLAIALRKNLMDVAYERSISVGRTEKAQQLFSYVTSHEFRQRVEALVEVFSEMQTQIMKERIAFEKSWKQREGQLQRLFINTAGMYGEMQGLVGSAMPEIKGLELEGKEQEQLSDGKLEEQRLF